MSSNGFAAAIQKKADSKEVLTNIMLSHRRVGHLLQFVADYRRAIGGYPNLVGPEIFREYLLRLKLSLDDRHPPRTTICDTDLSDSTLSPSSAIAGTADVSIRLHGIRWVARWCIPISRSSRSSS